MSTEPDRVEPMDTAARADDLQERLAAAERARDEALAERNRLWAQLNERTADRREVEHLRAELSAVRDSRAWELAARYQRVKRLVRRALERLRQA